MAHRRVLITALCALFLCGYAGASPAPGAPVAKAASKHARGHRVAPAHPLRCAKRASFHAGGGRPHHVRRGAGCSKRRFGARHRTAVRRGRSRRPGRHAPSHRHTGGRSHHHTRLPSRHHAGGPSNHNTRGPLQLHGNRRALAAHPPAAANSSSCPDTDLRPTQENLGRVRAATLCLVNHERAGAGESPLATNGRLEQGAQGHTEDMAVGDYFEHVAPRGDTPISRMRAVGYIYSSRIGYEIGENIGWGTLWLATPRAIVAAWMASPEHRANILDAHFRDTAIGVSSHPPTSLARGQAGAIYTEDFGVIITR